MAAKKQKQKYIVKNAPHFLAKYALKKFTQFIKNSPYIQKQKI